jgi:hypothetical protein
VQAHAFEGQGAAQKVAPPDAGGGAVHQVVLEVQAAGQLRGEVGVAVVPVVKGLEPAPPLAAEEEIQHPAGLLAAQAQVAPAPQAAVGKGRRLPQPGGQERVVGEYAAGRKGQR